MPVGFWNDPDGAKYHAAYFERFPGIWCHGDFAEWTEHGGMIIHGRSDATLNPGGVRIGTAEIYAQVETIPEVIEALAIGQDWDNDVRIVLFVRLKDGAALDDALVARIKAVIRTGASPRHVPAKIVAVADIPRTKSNKIVELAVREIVHGRAGQEPRGAGQPRGAGAVPGPAGAGDVEEVHRRRRGDAFRCRADRHPLPLGNSCRAEKPGEPRRRLRSLRFPRHLRRTPVVSFPSHARRRGPSRSAPAAGRSGGRRR